MHACAHVCYNMCSADISASNAYVQCADHRVRSSHENEQVARITFSFRYHSFQVGGTLHSNPSTQMILCERTIPNPLACSAHRPKPPGLCHHPVAHASNPVACITERCSGSNTTKHQRAIISRASFHRFCARVAGAGERR